GDVLAVAEIPLDEMDRLRPRLELARAGQPGQVEGEVDPVVHLGRVDVEDVEVLLRVRFDALDARIQRVPVDVRGPVRGGDVVARSINLDVPDEDRVHLGRD